MSHVRRSPSQQRRAAFRRRQTKRRSYGLIVMFVMFLSIILGIVFIISSSMP